MKSSLSVSVTCNCFEHHPTSALSCNQEHGWLAAVVKLQYFVTHLIFIPSLINNHLHKSEAFYDASD